MWRILAFVLPARGGEHTSSTLVDAVARQEPESCGGVTLAPPHRGTRYQHKLLDMGWRKQSHVLWKDRGKKVGGRNTVLRVNLCHYSAEGAMLILGFQHGSFCWGDQQHRRTDRAGCASGPELLTWRKYWNWNMPPNVQVSNERELQVVRFGNPCPSHPRSPLNISAALELFRALRALQTLCSRVIISLPEREKAELPGASANNRNMTIKISVFVFLGLSF